MELVTMSRRSSTQTTASSTLPSRVAAFLRPRCSTTAQSTADSQPRLPRNSTIPNPRRTSPSSTALPTSPSPASSPSDSPIDLEARAIFTLSALHSPASHHASAYISDAVTIQRDDGNVRASRADFLASWVQRRPSASSVSSTSSSSDDVDADPADDDNMEVVEAVVDDVQRKVWVRSRRRAAPGEPRPRKQSVEQLFFDADGLLVAYAPTM